MDIYKYIRKEDGGDLFSAGYDVATMFLNLEHAETMAEEAFNFYSGAYINTLDDAENEFSQTLKFKAQIALEEVAKRHGITYNELKDLIKYNSEGIVGAIVSAIINFFKAIIDFITSLFKSNGGGGGGGGHYSKEAVKKENAIDEAIDKAHAIVEELEEETIEISTHNEDEKTDDQKELEQLRFSIATKYKLLFRLLDVNGAISRYIASVTYMNDVYGIDIMKEQYIDYPINATTYKHVIDIKKNIGFPMPKYSNTEQWINIIKSKTDIDLNEYPNHEVLCTRISLIEKTDGVGETYVDLLILSSDCAQVKKVESVRVVFDSIYKWLGSKNKKNMYTKLFHREAKYIAGSNNFKNLPDYKVLSKDIKEMYKSFKALSKENVNDVFKERFELEGCKGNAPDYYSMVLKVLRISKATIVLNSRIRKSFDKIEKVAETALELMHDIAKIKKLTE